MNRRLAFWLAIFAGWTVLVVVFAASSSLTYALNYQPPRWRYTLAMAATEWYVWAAFTPIVAWLAKRLRPSRTRWRRAAALAAIGLPIAFIKVTLTRVLRQVGDGGTAYFQIDDLIIQYLIYWAIVLVTIVWLQYRRSQQRELRTSQLEAQLAETRLRMLNMQLQPHFLFNTLNTIAELVHQQPATAERMIGGLSHLLRETLHAGLIDRISLDQELALLDRYIEIQRARFGDRLIVDVRIADNNARQVLVPSLLLQPLVENSIKHGIGTRAGAGRIEVVVERRSSHLLIEVRDDGRGLDGRLKEGVGISNCRSRLRALYGDTSARFEIANRDGGGAVARIELPCQPDRVEASA
jgi:two-component system, LytTR family, sensor kinase